MNQNLIDDLEALIPQSRAVTTAVGDIVVAPLVTAQIPPFLRHSRPLFDAIEGGLNGDFDTQAPDWLTLLETHGEAIIQAVAVATGQAPATIGRLPPDQTIALVQAILEENLDFFVRRLLPAVSQLMTGIMERLRGMAGPTSSSGLSPTDITAATS